MAAETQYTANTGLVAISGANSSLTGSGTLLTNLWDVLVAGSTANGTVVKSIIIKSTTAVNTEGMVRLFIYDGTNTNLIQEVHVNPTTQAGTTTTFEYKWNCDLKLKPGNKLRATTQNNETFNVIAEGLDWTYFTGAVRPESTNFTANNGTTSNQVTVGTNGLSGTGANAKTVFTAAVSPGSNGCRIEEVEVQAIVTTTTGMVRLFISGGGAVYLLTEVFIPSVTLSSTEPAFTTIVPILSGFQLNAGYSIVATAQNSETFNIMIQGNDWKYPPASSITNLTPASGTAVTTEQLITSLQVPASLFNTGDVMRVYADLTTSGTGNKTWKMYINSTNTLTAATLLAQVLYTTTTAESFMRLFPVISATSLGSHGGSATSGQTQYDANAGTSANITVPNVTSGFWILISCTKGTAGDTDTANWMMVKKEN